jgi:hypothetical protein
LFYFAREAAGAAGTRLSLRPLFFQEANRSGKTRAKHAAGSRNCVCERVVIAGLDPAIHQSSQERFSKRMDGRVKPGHDEMS